MSNLSLDASIRTCKVQTGESQRIQSDRFLNPNNMVCIPWNGLNNKGQAVCEDSWYTKTPGCRSANDRVSVENELRPQYSDYINWNMGGLQGNIYGSNASAQSSTCHASKFADSRSKITGNFGNQWQSTNYATCGVNSYERAMASMAKAEREGSAANQAYLSARSRSMHSGCGH